VASRCLEAGISAAENIRSIRCQCSIQGSLSWLVDDGGSNWNRRSEKPGVGLGDYPSGSTSLGSKVDAIFKVAIKASDLKVFYPLQKVKVFLISLIFLVDSLSFIILFYPMRHNGVVAKSNATLYRRIQQTPTTLSPYFSAV